MDRYGLLCRSVFENPDVTQRELASILNVSLGSANRLMGECIQNGLIELDSEGGKYGLTEAGRSFLEQFRVDGAVIIAAGFGSRFVPLTFETPKGLLEVYGERMIERQIRQLQEAGVRNITIVVGYLKEKFEYLIDKYDIKLLYNPEYACKNTLATLFHARKEFMGKNMYLLASDNWLRENMYHLYECGAWYSSAFMKGETSEWCLTSNKKGRITDVSIGGRDSWVMYGPAFFSRAFSEQFFPLLEAAYHSPGTEQHYWEQIILDHVKELELFINCQPDNQVYEFENLEELRLFDSRYQNHSDNEAMQLVADVLQVKEAEIHNIRCLKAGMTNNSFLFEVKGAHYICRIPGPGTERLINREEEKAAYEAVSSLGITEQIIYFNGKNGYKIAKYYEGAKNADPKNREEMSACMALLRKLHSSGVRVSHTFLFREKIPYYESLCHGRQLLLFEDYEAVREKMSRLLKRLGKIKRPLCLSHIDSVADNFLILPDNSLRLIDWEYASMHDPLIDVSMCSIYSYYTEKELDWLLETYLEKAPSEEERFVTYAYAALGGFLWALWTVFKSLEGQEFGEYSIMMYHYAKQYYKKAGEIFPLL